MNGRAKGPLLVRHLGDPSNGLNDPPLEKIDWNAAVHCVHCVQDALQDSELCRCLKTFEDLSESKCSRTRVEKCRLVSPT